jgi:aspartyl-tRNA(Asn)/glutamyl-tRNA(Gln) amidotransferase subunit C
MLYFCIMEINDELVNKLANLSRLQFDESEKVGIKSDLEKMIRFVETLNEVETKEVEPLLFIGDNVNVLRDDHPKQEISLHEALKNSPVKDPSFFKVPKVIKK